MTRKLVLVLVAVGAAIGSTLSIVAIPWVRSYVDVPLQRFPGWVGYLVGAVILHACMAWGLAVRRMHRTALVCGIAAALFTVTYAAVLMSRYRDVRVSSDSTFVPLVMVMPRLGLGGFVGIVSAALAAAVLIASARSR